jgi:hypothetical protein
MQKALARHGDLPLDIEAARSAHMAKWQELEVLQIRLRQGLDALG